MTKAELSILEKAYAAEITGALSGGLQIFQTKSKIAKKLADEGFLKAEAITLPGRFPVTIEGYSLTLLGNFTYCTSL